MGRYKSYSAALERAQQSDEDGKTNGAFEAETVFMSPSDHCFYCGNPLGDDLVYWRGSDENSTQIWMHPKCACELSQHLIKDGFN
jgi:hypothetical protein